LGSSLPLVVVFFSSSSSSSCSSFFREFGVVVCPSVRLSVRPSVRPSFADYNSRVGVRNQSIRSWGYLDSSPPIRSSILHQKAPPSPPPSPPAHLLPCLFPLPARHPPLLRPHLPLFSLPSFLPTFRDSPKISYLPFLHRNHKCLLRRRILVHSSSSFASSAPDGYVVTYHPSDCPENSNSLKKKKKKKISSLSLPFFILFFWGLS
jgi:hypothetical protein